MRVLVCTLLVATGCAAGDVDLAGKSCPCAEGWYCDVALRTCLPGIPPGGDGGGRIDAGPDAAMPLRDATVRDGSSLDAETDASGADAARTDAGPNDAAPRDSAPPDAGPPDSGVPDDTRCDDLHAGAIFCDGLEAAGFAAWTSFYEVDGSIQRSTTQTYLGVGSLDAETTAAGGYAAVRRVLPATVTTGDLYLRAYVYVPATVPVPGSYSLVQVGYDGSPYHHLSLGVSSAGAAALYIQAEGGGRSVIGDPLPRDTWVCLEGHVSISDTAGVAELWMAGTVQGSPITGFDTSPTGGYERLVAGLPYTDPSRTSTAVYVDEVVLSTTRIGCD